ncbi:hypothetical protein TNCV_762821 [Trichonephila clavipes]|nr:hypothetical protein TNCV_762821 [Trichonephila clavipes]
MRELGEVCVVQSGRSLLKPVGVGMSEKMELWVPKRSQNSIRYWSARSVPIGQERVRERILRSWKILNALRIKLKYYEVSNELEFVTLCQDRRVIGKHANRGLAGSRNIVYVDIE